MKLTPYEKAQKAASKYWDNDPIDITDAKRTGRYSIFISGYISGYLEGKKARRLVKKKVKK